ncbi:RNA polymerase sigma-70 factor, ECF subfamily [Neorhodopirellula lusitana]|uniref:RNA polymerase sigma-70 factor, ECF subfamily n=1 Tax=Neorhodopirellula lusitana TaxID=445327 RepID=A0ABY1QM51_9BACT|nr:sigma-70 family RNA polymerase sigma factor [Neorhodopirellula lusitana]SMP75331.1 RNA polymerase sigma-70 factor, ECF subfamily [Neorhodopirellula lusitana]
MEDSPDDLSDWLTDAVDCHEHRLLSYAKCLLRDRTTAQDAVQETFLQLCRKAREIAASPDPPTLLEFAERLTPWLFTVCRTRVIDMQRKRNPHSFARSGTATRSGDPNDDAPEANVVDPSPMPEDTAIADEEQQQVADSIGNLTPRQREILQLRMQGGLSYREIADVTGLTPTNVGFHLHQAVASLRQTLVNA